MVQKWSSQEEKLHVWQNLMDTSVLETPTVGRALKGREVAALEKLDLRCSGVS